MENYGLIALKMIISKSKSLRLYLKYVGRASLQDVNNVVNALKDKGFIESDRDRITKTNSQR